MMLYDTKGCLFLLKAPGVGVGHACALWAVLMVLRASPTPSQSAHFCHLLPRPLASDSF